MGRARAARRLAAAAAFGGGGLGVLGGSLYGLLVAQARLARQAIGPAQDIPPDGSGLYGRRYPGDPISLGILGDSSAAGYGVQRADETPGAQLAAGLAQLAGRPVRLTSVARVGARTVSLDKQIDQIMPARPQAAAILIGVNDITHKVRPSDSVRLLADAVRRLRASGCAVIVGTCPDMGTVQPIPPPLRQVARLWSRRLAAAQTIAVVEAGGVSVSMTTVLGPEFRAAPSEYFGPDRFHPSAFGYASAAAGLLPSVASALGFGPPEEEEPEAFRGEGVLPVAVAAVEAANVSGTEVASTQVDGQERGPGGRWALLRHRRRRPAPVLENEALAEAGARPDVRTGLETAPDTQSASGLA